MFEGAQRFNRPLSTFVTSRVTAMDRMFRGCENFYGSGLERWNTGRLVSATRMFENVSADPERWRCCDAIALLHRNSPWFAFLTRMLQIQAYRFNGDVRRWNTARLLRASFMFSGCDAFNRDLSRWDSRLLSDAEGMFQSALAFNQDLCAWGNKMSNESIVYGMFYYSACLSETDPEYTPLRNGPFCRDCSSVRPKLPSITEGPMTLPLVPAAVSNLPDGRILAWAGERQYQSHGDVSPEGTFTSIFDPVSGNSSLLRVESKLDIQRYLCRKQSFACIAHSHSTAAVSRYVLDQILWIRHGTLSPGPLSVNRFQVTSSGLTP
jgi:hypothetical protein